MNPDSTGPASSHLRPDEGNPRPAFWARIAWEIYLGAICLIVAADPWAHTVTPRYRQASELWWRGRDIYLGTVDGYLYLPHAAILYSAFTRAGIVMGEILWRLAGGLLLATAIYRLSRCVGGKAWPAVFLGVSLLSMGPGASAIQNGQVNTFLTGLMIHAAVDLTQRRWTRSTFILVLAVALKPTAIVMVMLVGAIYSRRMTWHLGVGLLLMLLLPFAIQPYALHLDPQYVLRQYHLFVQTLRVADRASGFVGADIMGMLTAWHFRPTAALYLATRVVGAGATLVLAWLAVRRRGPIWGPVLLACLAASFVLLLNPRTENNGYTILAPYVAILAVTTLRSNLRSAGGWVLVALCLGLGYGRFLNHGREMLWLPPALGCLFVPCLTYLICARRTLLPSIPPSPGSPVPPETPAAPETPKPMAEGQGATVTAPPRSTTPIG